MRERYAAFVSAGFLLAVAQFTLLTANGAQSFSAGTAAIPKPPWSWTPQERLQLRFDPTRKSERLNVALTKFHIRQLRPGMTPVVGSLNPELLFPSELLDQFLMTTIVVAGERSDRIDHNRQTYIPQIRSAGWDENEFWRFVDTAAAGYAAALSSMTEIQRKTRSNGKNAPHWNELALQFCEQRASFFEAARTKYGAEAFDKFLYTAVAPRTTIWTSDEAGGSAFLSAEEGPCK